MRRHGKGVGCCCCCCCACLAGSVRWEGRRSTGRQQNKSRVRGGFRPTPSPSIHSSPQPINCYLRSSIPHRPVGREAGAVRLWGLPGWGLCGLEGVARRAAHCGAHLKRQVHFWWPCVIDVVLLCNPVALAPCLPVSWPIVLDFDTYIQPIAMLQCWFTLTMRITERRIKAREAMRGVRVDAKANHCCPLLRHS